jgi:hypothetical protein
MSTSEQDAFADFLFGQEGVEVLDIKFMPGLDPALTAGELCVTAHGVLKTFWQQSGPAVDQPPSGRKSPRHVAEVFSTY